MVGLEELEELARHIRWAGPPIRFRVAAAAAQMSPPPILAVWVVAVRAVPRAVRACEELPTRAAAAAAAGAAAAVVVRAGQAS
jgi:hypothetical protein